MEPVPDSDKPSAPLRPIPNDAGRTLRPVPTIYSCAAEVARDFVEGVPVENHTVLFVDDEVNILKALQRLLRNEPIDVLTASTPSEAFELIERAGPQVIVSDQRMPEMSGVDFLASVA